MTKEEIMLEIAEIAGIPSQLAKVGNGSTEKREFLQELARKLAIAIDDDSTKEVLVVQIFEKLSIQFEDGKSVSNGASVVKDSMSAILEKLKKLFAVYL